MNVSSLIKQLKRRLRYRRRSVSLGAFALLLAAVWSIAAAGDQHGAIESLSMLVNRKDVQLEQAAVVVSAQDAGSVEAVEEPMLQMNTYFGIDDQGQLNLYEGLPAQQRLIRSFFQLDIEYLESSLPPALIEHLRQGILVTDYEEYASVLSTFSEFAAIEYTL